MDNHLGDRLMRLIASAIIFLSFIPPASADLTSSEPAQLCTYLNDIGLTTQGWKNQYDDEFGCSSPYKEIGTGSPLANNLAYYVEGNATTATTAKLVININNKNLATSAHNELLKAAEKLSIKLSNHKLPVELSKAIISGKKASQEVGPISIEVIHLDWPTGKGYEVKVLFN